MNDLRNFMIVNTVTATGVTRMEVELADDNNEVRGFGQPISEHVAREMTNSFYLDCKKAYEIVRILETEKTYTMLEDDKNFEALKRLLAPETQVVSGVFGKEILLQMLAQRDCEGLRYALATDHNGKNTVVLFGVRQVLQKDGSDQMISVNAAGRTHDVAQSEPLSKNSAGLKIRLTTDPINSEVHKNSITREEAEKNKKEGMVDSIDDVIFGLY